MGLKHAVEAALKNPDRSHRKLWATREGVESLDGELPSDFPVEWAQPADLARLVAKDAPHQGLVLECAPLDDMFLADVLDGDPARPVVVLDQVTDPHNVGAIMRSAAAFDACCIVTQDRHAPPESGTLAKSASGALEVLPGSRGEPRPRTRGNRRSGLLAHRPGWIGRIDARRGPSHRPGRTRARRRGDGMRHNITQHCDAIAKLPISEAMESLNVSNAAAIALYAAATRETE
ncbi:TrmH family RNA methyltransferase [Novosphingobium resinovorum]|uniref:TrmH family RNA methyltransferase n=1 Tax=Novosphingobium resinovorum TaxID=158500 RepID=UPI003611C11F